MKVLFSELALAGIAREFPDHSRQESCKVSLSFYLQVDNSERHFLCPAFDDRKIYIYSFGAEWRATYEVLQVEVLVWTFGRFADLDQ